MTAQEKWAAGIVAGAVLSAVLTPILTPVLTPIGNELRDKYWCRHCGARKIVGADGQRYCPNGHVELAMPYRVADTDIPETCLSGYPWG